MDKVNLSGYTALKQNWLGKIFQALMLHFNKSKTEVRIVDITAGAGRDRTQNGSPIIMAYILHKIQTRLKFKYRIYAIEKTPSTFNCLLENTRDCPNQDKIYPLIGDQVDLLPAIIDGSKRGVIYLDPCGEIDFSTMIRLAKTGMLKNFDVLINIPESSFRRHSVQHKHPKLIGQLNELRKKYWFCSPAFGESRWIRMLGTNKRSDSLLKALESERMMPAYSHTGRLTFLETLGGELGKKVWKKPRIN